RARRVCWQPSTRRIRHRRRGGRGRAAGPSGVRTAAMPRRWLPLDARLLGVGRWQLLLGPRHLGRATAARLPVDAWILGLGWPRLCLPRGLLGRARRILWWCRLRLRLLRTRVRRRPLGRRTLLL